MTTYYQVVDEGQFVQGQPEGVILGYIQDAPPEFPDEGTIYILAADDLDIHQLYDFSLMDFYYPKDYLKILVHNKLISAVAQNIDFLEVETPLYKFDIPTWTQLADAARREESAAIREMVLYDNSVVEITNAELIEFVDSYWARAQNYSDVYKGMLARVDNEDITVPVDIETCWAIDVGNYINERAVLPTLEEISSAVSDLIDNDTAFAIMIDTKVDKVTGKALSKNDFTDTLKAKVDGIAASATANASDADLLARANHTGTQSADTITDGTTNKAYTATEKTKLAGITAGATANDTDANLKARANHTGTQTASTISDFSSAADSRISAQKGANSGLAPLDSGGKVASTYLPSYVDDVLEYANLAGLPGTGETGKIYVALDTGKIYRWSGSAYVEISGSPGSTDVVTEGSSNLYFTAPRARAAFRAYAGTTAKDGSFPIFKNFTIASAGTAVFYLTDDGLSTGNALFTNGPIMDSLNVYVNDSAASYQWSAALTNSNKTLTVTINKLTTASLLTGVLGQAAAPIGTVVRMGIWGN